MDSTIHTDVSGWTPLNGDDEDVIVSQDIYSMTTINTLPSSDGSGSFLRPTCPPLDAIHIYAGSYASISPLTSRSDLLPPGPLASFPRPMAPSSDRRAQRNRSRDPGWIPRPRNAFIIFRCEYSKEHLQNSQQDSEESTDTTTNPTAKTLSKRAADAWKQLSPEERDRYKVLADKEREEHARAYPHYRFRPMRRQPTGNKRMFRVALQSAHTQASEEPFLIAQTRLPSVLEPNPVVPQVKAQSEEPVPQSRQDIQPSLIMSRRRSSSAPNADLLSLPYVVPSQRDRRSSSVIEKARLAAMPSPWQVTAAPLLGHSSYSMNSDADPVGPATLNYDYSFFTSAPEVTFQPVFSSDENSEPIYMPSPLTTATSSLINWNGEFGPPSPGTSAPASTSSTEVTPSVSSSPQPLMDDSCPPHWSPPIGIPPDAFLSGSASYRPDQSYGDPGRAQALEAYTIGLYYHDFFTGPSALFPEDLSGGPYESENVAVFPDHSLGV